MSRRWIRGMAVGVAMLFGIAIVAASLIIPIALLLGTDEKMLARWAQIGDDLTPMGVFFSGIAFLGIATTLLLQGRELGNQREELVVAREEQQRNSEIVAAAP